MIIDRPTQARKRDAVIAAVVLVALSIAAALLPFTSVPERVLTTISTIQLVCSIYLAIELPRLLRAIPEEGTPSDGAASPAREP